MSRKRPARDPTHIPPHAGGSDSASRPYRDLCSTCNHAGACGHRSTPERPVFFCELFEASVPVSAAAAATAAPKRQAKPPKATELKGLCMNCENRKTCTTPKPQGGIWHCEEYR